MKSNLLVEQHFHGCYGIDFNKADADEILYLSREILKEGIGFIFPTLVTDTVENIKRQIRIIKTASEKQTEDMAKICGVHLEGIFLNPEKKGIHNEKHFLSPTLENYKLVEDDFIKIITIAPELASADLLSYLRNKSVKIQAGHCIGGDLSDCSGTTHTFNAMSAISHKSKSTALSALINDNLYCEIIADGVHVCDDALKLFIKSKPNDKIILVSDCLPCTRSKLSEFTFADKKVYYDGKKATSKDGTLAGSTVLLPDIIKLLASKNLFKDEFIQNPYKYHSIPPKGEIEWDENYNIVNINL
jgi:N-acetylglucosamine-6-phosphate deacetylase